MKSVGSCEILVSDCTITLINFVKNKIPRNKKYPPIPATSALLNLLKNFGLLTEDETNSAFKTTS